MDRKAKLMSIGLAVFAMYLVYQYVSTKADELEAQFGENSMSPVVVASRDILQFQTIRPTDLDVVMVPAALIPPGRIRNVEDVIDAVAAIPLRAGENVLDTKIISKNLYSGLNTQVAKGRRAISVPVGIKSGVGFHVEPGNRVDLAAHFEYKTKKSGISEIKVFLQDLLVLAVGRTIQTEAPRGVDQRILTSILPKDQSLNAQELKVYRETLNYAKRDTDYRSVTLEVTPLQAQKIAYVMSTGFKESFVMMLRNTNDRQRNRAGTTNMTKIMGKDSYFVRHKRLPPPARVAVPKGYDFIGGVPKPYYD